MKNRILLVALLIATSSAFAQVPSYVPTNGLVGWWPFNGNANDESGNGNNGTVNGPSLTFDRFGNTSNAYQFNSGSDLICTSNYFNSPNVLTYSVWMKSSNVGYLMGFNLGQCYHGGNWDRTIIIDGTNQFRFLTFPGTIVSTVASTNIINNEWNHIVITMDGSGSKIYVNGGLVVSNSSQTAGENFTGYYRFGGLSPNNLNNSVVGSLDDVGIWNRALTQQEITALYNAQSCNSTSNTIIADGPTTFCAGNYVNLTSDLVGGTYQWKKNGVNITTNGTSRTYKATATGSYTCVATCNGTALTSNAIQVTTKTNAFASVTASGATSFCLGDSVTLNCTNLGSNYSVQWYRTNISMENATNYSLVVKQPGTYKVVTKNLTTGCSRISGSAITTSVNCRMAGDITSGTTTEENTTNEARFTANDLSQGVNVFPNPNNGTFTFAYDGEETGDGVLQVINTMGQSIYNSAVTIQEGGYTQEIQLGDNYNKGFYIVRLLINGSYHDSRVMVR